MGNSQSNNRQKPVFFGVSMIEVESGAIVLDKGVKRVVKRCYPVSCKVFPQSGSYLFEHKGIIIPKQRLLNEFFEFSTVGSIQELNKIFQKYTYFEGNTGQYVFFLIEYTDKHIFPYI